MTDIEPQKVKKYLSELRWMNQNINSRQRELDSIRRSFLKTSTIKDDKVQESGGQYDDKYMLLLEISDEISAEVDLLVNKQRDVRQQIDQLDNALSVIVLRERYLNNQTWEEIAETTGQSVRNVHNLHGRALVEFGERFQERIYEHS